jgi:hypothetical protein
MKTGWHHYMWKLKWTFGSHMNENQVGESILLSQMFFEELNMFS